MALKNVGRVQPIWRGDYDPTASYGILDFVKHNGTVWTPTEDVTGVEPSVAAAQWEKMLESGVQPGAVGAESVTTATGTQTVVGALDQRGPVFDSVADMKAASGLTVGIKCRTLGYYEPGDGGGNDYEIVAAGTGSNYGFLYEQLTASGHEAKLLGGGIMEDKTAYIPSDYATLQEAIDGLGHIQTSKGAIIDLMIESGHQPASGISVSDGSYNHFRVSSQDAEVVLSASFGTTSRFILAERAMCPTLNCLVDANSQASTGYRLEDNSTGYVTPGSGVKFCWSTGLSASNGSSCTADNTVFTNNAVNAATGAGIVTITSFVSAFGADVSDSSYYGAQASEGGILNFRTGKANRTGRYGMRARNGGVIDAQGAFASDNAVNGVRAFNQGIVHCRYITATGNADADLYASGGSIVNAGDSTLGGPATNIASVFATSGSVITCANGTIDGGSIGILAERGSTIVGSYVVITNAATSVKGDKGCTLEIEEANLTTTANGIRLDNKTDCNANNVVISGGTDAINIALNSSLNFNGGEATGYSNRGLLVTDGASANCVAATIQATIGTDASTDIVVQRGGIVAAASSSGGISITANTITSSGIIFR